MREKHIKPKAISEAMSQESVCLFLKKHHAQWFSRKQIQYFLRQSQASICNNLSKLMKHKLIECKRERENCTRMIYHYIGKKNGN